MSVITQVFPVEGIDTEGSPPCGTHEPVTFALCGKPSAYRMLSICSCGDRSRGFICGDCKIWIDKMEGTCMLCSHPRGATGYC